MVVVKNVRICNLSEYQSNNVGGVALESCVHSVWDFLAWGNDAQVNLVSVLQQCIEIGVSISSESFYHACGAYEAPFGECLAGVREQDGCGSGLMRSTPGHYSVRRYPRALIEMHVFSRENNAIFCGLWAADSRKLQSFVHVNGLHDGWRQLGKPTIARTMVNFFAIVSFAVSFVFILAILPGYFFWFPDVFSRLIESGLFAWGLSCRSPSVWRSSFLSSERWTWWWWW